MGLPGAVQQAGGGVAGEAAALLGQLDEGELGRQGRGAQPQVQDGQLVFQVGGEEDDGRGVAGLVDGGAGQAEDGFGGEAVAQLGVDVVGAQDDPGQLGPGVGILVGQAGAADHADGAPAMDVSGLLQCGRHRVEGFGPADLDQFVTLAHEGGGHPLHAAESLPVEAALVAQPALVDRVGVDAQFAGDVVTARLDGDPAPHGAGRAAALGLLDIPRPGLEAVRGAREGADRADLNRVAAEVGGEGLAREGRHLDHVAAHGEVDLGIARDLVGKTGAASALDAAFAVEQDQFGEGDGLLPVALLLDEAGLARAEGERLVLEGAFAALVTHRAVQRVVDQEEFQHPVLGLLDAGGGGVDHLAVGHAHEARRGQGGPSGSHDLDQAHAAHADWLHAGVVTEARDVHPGPFGRGDDHLALVGLDGAAVEGDGHLFGRLLRSHGGRPLL